MTKHSPAEQALCDVGDIAQNANNVVAKVALRCHQPELALEVKAVFEQLLVLNTALTYALRQTDARSMEREVEDMHAFVGRHSLSTNSISDLPEQILSANAGDRVQALATVRGLLLLLAASNVDTSVLDVVKHTPVKGEPVDYTASHPTPELWHRASVEHDVLLALTRCYRFMIEASPEMLEAKNTSRTKLLCTARILETKAAVSGIET